MIPIVATEPSCFTHSCEDAYLSPSNTAKIDINTYMFPHSFNLIGKRRVHMKEYQLRNIWRWKKEGRDVIWRKKKRV